LEDRLPGIDNANAVRVFSARRPVKRILPLLYHKSRWRPRQNWFFPKSYMENCPTHGWKEERRRPGPWIKSFQG